MEELVEFLQETLAKDFFFEDDFVIEQLQISMAELKRAKLDLPEPGKELARHFMYNLQLRSGDTVQLAWPIAGENCMLVMTSCTSVSRWLLTASLF